MNVFDDIDSVHSPSMHLPPEPPSSPVFDMTGAPATDPPLMSPPTDASEAPPNTYQNPNATSPKLEELNRQIAARTAAMDAAAAEKEKNIEKAARKYLEAQMAQLEKSVAEAREQNRALQREKKSQLQEHTDGTIWRNVGVMMDLAKPNKYSKNTERMRSIFRSMNSSTTDA